MALANIKRKANELKKIVEIEKVTSSKFKNKTYSDLLLVDMPQVFTEFK